MSSVTIPESLPVETCEVVTWSSTSTALLCTLPACSIYDRTLTRGGREGIRRQTLPLRESNTGFLFSPLKFCQCWHWNQVDKFPMNELTSLFVSYSPILRDPLAHFHVGIWNGRSPSPHWGCPAKEKKAPYRGLSYPDSILKLSLFTMWYNAQPAFIAQRSVIKF